MVWWQEEYEGLRAEARDMATTIAAYTASVSAASSANADPLASMRGRLAALEVVSPDGVDEVIEGCLLYTSPSPRDGLLSRMPSSA